MSHLKLASVVFALLGFTALVWASEADELREKAEAMRREAAELAEQGHAEEAEDIRRRAVAIHEEAEQLERRRQRRRPEQHVTDVENLERFLEKLRQEEERLREHGGSEDQIARLRREGEQVERELRELSQRPRREHDVERDEGRDEGAGHHELAERLEHMHIAIEHLNRAGLHEIAEHVAHRAEAAEQELHEHRPHHDGDVMHAVIQQLEELQHEIGRLRDEVNELRERR